MPFPEKLALLEAVWAELSSDPDLIEIPQWHKDVIDERMTAAADGTADVMDWGQAKKQISKMLG